MKPTPPPTPADAPPDLPDLHGGMLDDATVAALFDDVAGCTRLIEVVVKQRHGVQTPDNDVSLREAQQLLAERRVAGVQLRYVHDGTQWWDTLLSMPQGTRLVRIRHDPVTPAP